MSMFERLFGQRQENPLAKLHPDFKITHDNFWYFNRDPNLLDQDISIKSRYSFDDPALLDACPFLAKLGSNDDPLLTAKYIGFTYTAPAKKDELLEWVRRFPYAELIDNLDHDGVVTEKSTVSIIKTPEK